MSLHIVQIPRDEYSVSYYLEKYKAFRLLALKTSPEAFGSTFARECEFTDDVWYDRLANPKATTFLTMEEVRIVCTLTAIGPLPCTVEQSSPTRDPWIPVNIVASGEHLPLHYRFNGMFTTPDVRGRGIAKSIVKQAIQVGLKLAKEKCQEYTASIVVDADNPAAIALYAKSGFVSIREETLPGTSRVVILMKYSASPKQVRLQKDDT